MDMGLKGTVALVAASSQGLGKAIAMELAREGANLAMCARGDEELAAAADEIRNETGAGILAIPTDLTKDEEIKSLVARTAEHFGRIDILVNNAGGPPSGPFEKQGDEAWEQAFRLNLMSAVRLIRECLPHLQAGGRGRIINMTSTSVKQPIEGLLLSNSIRSGVVGMAKTLSGEFAQYGITVNNVAPGRFNTARIKYLDQARAKATGSTEEEARRAWLAEIPMGRYGFPEEVAYLVAFLASDKASYITGTTIQVDGGMVKGML
jgi:3-oxoacyl-[acyl-carrier protein] reductase